MTPNMLMVVALKKWKMVPDLGTHKIPLQNHPKANVEQIKSSKEPLHPNPKRQLLSDLHSSLHLNKSVYGCLETWKPKPQPAINILIESMNIHDQFASLEDKIP